jgi:hypothetical protein
MRALTTQAGTPMIKDATLRKIARLIEKVLAFLGSYGLAVVILSFQLLLTFLGTIAQANEGLYLVQKKYFDSFFLWQPIYGPLAIPLPGGYLLMLLLFYNLLVGGIIRAPRRLRQPGMLIAHGGILFLLISGFVSHHFSLNGGMQILEGESSAEFASYHDWSIELRRQVGDTVTVYQIPDSRLKTAGAGAERTFVADDLPVDITVAGYAVNCVPRPAGEAMLSAAVDGFYLQTVPRADAGERNVPGSYVLLAEKGGGPTHSAIVWGLERAPYTTTLGGEQWSVAMVRQSWPLPFRIVLDKLSVQFHPNTGMAKVFLSDVTKIEGRSHESIKITMNEPFRYKGYTLFQSSWGPANAPEGARLYSGFAVVKNPVDHWPLYACIIVSIGLLIHFFQRLAVHLRGERT